MLKIKLKDGVSIQNWNPTDDDADEGIYVFRSGAKIHDTNLDGPFVWIEVKDGYLECHTMNDMVIESSTEMKAARDAGLTDDEIYEKFRIDKEA